MIDIFFLTSIAAQLRLEEQGIIMSDLRHYRAFGQSQLTNELTFYGCCCC